MNSLTSRGIEDRLEEVGALLREGGTPTTILVVGGAALLLHGAAHRLTTGDIDVLAALESGTLVCPYPLPAPLAEAAREVAMAHDLPPDWINAIVARSWSHRWPEGLPPDLVSDAEWRVYGGLTVGLAGRSALIPLKIHAVADRARARGFSPEGHISGVDFSPPEAQRHLRDLVALAPTDDELREARAWIFNQDTSPHLITFLDAIERHVREHRP